MKFQNPGRIHRASPNQLNCAAARDEKDPIEVEFDVWKQSQPLRSKWQSWAGRVRGLGVYLPWLEWRSWGYLMVPKVCWPYRGLPPAGYMITPRGKLKAGRPMK
jgi:hypothetical protein